MKGAPPLRLPTRARARTRVPAAAFLVVLACATLQASGAASTTVVTMTVPSAVSLTNSCTQSAGREFGTVQPGSPALTSTGADVCRFDFSSSNDSAQLRLGTADASGSAMTTGFTTTGNPGSSDQYLGATAGPGGISIGMRGTGEVHRSVDHGMTWGVHGTGLPYDPAGSTGAWWWHDVEVSPTNALRLWAAGGLGWVMRSTDGGASWERIATPTLGTRDVYDIEVVSDSVVFVAASGGGTTRVLRTTTADAATAAGVSWDVDQAVSGTYVYSIGASDASNVWISTDGGLQRSSTGGTGWAVFGPGWGNQVNALDMVSSTEVVLVGQDGKVARTSNATSTPPTWTQVRIPAEVDHISELDAVDASTWFVAGQRGALYRTTNAGTNWTRIANPTLSQPHAVAGWDASRAVVGGDGRRMIATGDGTTWTIRDTGTAVGSFLTGVAAVAGTQVVVASAEQGRIRRSTDFGASVTTITTPTTQHLFSIASGQAAAKTLFASGAGGTVIRSVDAGVTWSSTSPTGTTQELLGVAVWDELNAYAVGRGGVVVRTRNGGTTWEVMTSPAAVVLRAVDVIGPDTVLVGAEDGKIYRSTNGGTGWSTISPPSGSSPLAAIDVVDGADVVWATAGWNTSMVSVDGGVTWTLRALAGRSGYGVAAVSADSAYASTYSGNILHTTDGGLTWTLSTIGSNYKGVFWDVTTIDTSRAVSVGDRGAFGRLEPGSSIADYENDGVGADDDWAAGAGTDLFGVCLQAVGGTTTPVWGVDGNSTCTAADGDPWRAVPNGTDKVATTSGPGVAGRVEFVWGFRAASTQPAGRYRARIVVEALAPSV